MTKQASPLQHKGRTTLGKMAAAVGLALATGLAATAAQAQGAAPKITPKISDGVIKIGLLNDMNSLYADLTGVGTVEAVKLAVEDMGGKIHGFPIEVVFADHQNKADLGRLEGARVVRLAEGRHAGRRRCFGDRAGRVGSRQAAQQARAAVGPGHQPPDQRELQRGHRALRVGHLRAGRRGRPRRREGRRRYLVLPDRGLRLRPFAGEGHLRRRQGRGRQGPGQRAPSAEHQRLLVVPAAGPGLEGEDHRPGECRRRHGQLDQGAPTSSASPRTRSSPACCCSSTTCTRWVWGSPRACSWPRRSTGT